MKIFTLALLFLISIHGYSQKFTPKFLIGTWEGTDSVQSSNDYTEKRTLKFKDVDTVSTISRDAINDTLVGTSVGTYKVYPSDDTNRDTLVIHTLIYDNTPTSKTHWEGWMFHSLIEVINVNSIRLTGFTRSKDKRGKYKYIYYPATIYRRVL